MPMRAAIDRSPMMLGIEDPDGRCPDRVVGRVLHAALRVLAVALAVLGAGSLLSGGVPGHRATAAPVPAASWISPVLADLALDGEQERRVVEMVRLEEPWVRRLEQALAEARGDLRRAELAQPYDETLVAALLDRHTELSAHLRGTESRLIGRIARVLTPDQQRQLAALRLDEGGSPAQQ